MSTMEPAGGLAVEERTETHLAEPGDHERLSHYFDQKKWGDVTEVYIEGREVIALCGKAWVPTRDAKRYPVCGTCKDVLDRLFPEA